VVTVDTRDGEEKSRQRRRCSWEGVGGGDGDGGCDGGGIFER